MFAIFRKSPFKGDLEGRLKGERGGLHLEGIPLPILRLAVPSILANITVPLVGMVDIAIAGHIADASAMGGIAMGAMLFSLLYWNFGFLRVGTGGLTAQAYGRGDTADRAALLTQSLFLALSSALLLLLTGWIVVEITLCCVPCTPTVASFARSYYHIRIWAAPATLSLMALKGWFIGSQNTVSPMIVDIVVNVANMVFSYFLAVHTPLGPLGVAYGTLIAQWTGLLVALALLGFRYHRTIFPHIHLRGNLRWERLRRMLHFGGNLMLRSLGFMVVYVGFTSLTSAYGDAALAVGAVMMQLFMLFSYFVDGFAYAGEALVGRFIGAQDRQQTQRAVRQLMIWCLGVGLVFTLLYALFGQGMVNLFTTDAAVRTDAHPLLPWLVAMPLVSCAAFMWDGIYIGATAGRQVRDCMLLAALAFILTYVAFRIPCGIHAVYAAYLAHLIVRTLYLWLKWPSTLSLRFHQENEE